MKRITVEPHWNLNIEGTDEIQESTLITVEPHWNLNKITMYVFLLIYFITVEPHWNLNSTEMWFIQYNAELQLNHIGI